jgi:hypothetical protein
MTSRTPIRDKFAAAIVASLRSSLAKPCESILEFLEESCPEASFQFPKRSPGTCTIEMRTGSIYVVVEWSPTHAFDVSVSTDDDAPPKEHDRSFASPEEVIDFLAKALA